MVLAFVRQCVQITYLGHAGFCVETAHCIILIDPWLSEHGAFDAAWFQYPKNQHLQADIHQLFSGSPKQKFLYISHEHQDHFDLEFLLSLRPYAFTLLLAQFDYPVIKTTLIAHQLTQPIVSLTHQQAYAFPDGQLCLFIIDSELNCDSAILIQTTHGVLLNLNDCKIYDQLESIVAQYGTIDVLTAQFSGASWYPTCYQLSEQEYRQACEHKIAAKFNAVKQAIQTVQPKVFIPSAGPPCFLDPQLLAINFQPINTYPRASALIAYLQQWEEAMPGDRLNVANLHWTRATPIIPEADVEATIRAYAHEKQPLFLARAAAEKHINPQAVFDALKPALQAKLAQLTTLSHTMTTCLYWQITEHPKMLYCVDLQKKTVDLVDKVRDKSNFCQITAPASMVAKVLNQTLSWSEFALTLRVNIERVPNVYNTLLHGFLILPTEKLRSFCEKLAAIEHNQERITIEYAGQHYSILRYCPHQGGDLALAKREGAYLICPRHQWKFDLLKHGQCSDNACSIEAIRLED
jgi:UDP-MurNAc hydroxylase